MDFLVELAGFAAKGFIVFLTVAASAAVLARLIRRAQRSSRGWLEVKHLNERFDGLRDGLQLGVSRNRAEAKQVLKQQKARDAAASDAERPRVYVIDFDGDILATATSSLREEVTAIVGAARPKDEVVVRLESAGGAVPHYGLAAAQLKRLKERNLSLTVCVDRVAASGGYMMACVADHIV
ncbi:MAG: hypothetical protein JNG84_00795, partial [Archangium sp.]|nr:hypothetical protein [Archangium sp.]